MKFLLKGIVLKDGEGKILCIRTCTIKRKEAIQEASFYDINKNILLLNDVNKSLIPIPSSDVSNGF